LLKNFKITGFAALKRVIDSNELLRGKAYHSS